MKMHEMPGYGEQVLACWFEDHYLFDEVWLLKELKLRRDGSLKWRDAYREHNGSARGVYFKTPEEARVEAERLNPIHYESINELPLDEPLKESLRLKARKTIYIKSRIFDEEALMKSEALRRSASHSAPARNELVLHTLAEPFRDALFDVLSAAPFLPIALVTADDRRVILVRKGGKWGSPIGVNRKNYLYAKRAYISIPFGFSPVEDWRKTKAQVRKILLPRANQLLELASVKMILADLERQGIKVAVGGGYAFWYESEGEGGWTIKEIQGESDSSGETLWREGTILSRNHGRIIVLPYVKADGSLVQGHTKNAAADGKAPARHHTQYVELPFTVLRSDLMKGLFGELPYE